MPLSREVDLGSGHTAVDGNPAPPEKGHSTPSFRPCLLWPNGRLSHLLLNTCYICFMTYFYDPISTIVSGLWSVITAHNLSPEKRDNNYRPTL